VVPTNNRNGGAVSVEWDPEHGGWFGFKVDRSDVRNGKDSSYSALETLPRRFHAYVRAAAGRMCTAKLCTNRRYPTSAMCQKHTRRGTA
jgi:hypothetical protein